MAIAVVGGIAKDLVYTAMFKKTAATHSLRPLTFSPLARVFWGGI